MTENQLQQQIVIFEKNNYSMKNESLIFSVPNGGTRNIVEAMTLKKTGTLAGVSDLILIIKNDIFFVELKTEKGIQSAEQKKFEEKIISFGFKYILIRSIEEYKQFRLSL